MPVFDANFAMKALRPRQEKSLRPASQFSGPFGQLWSTLDLTLLEEGRGQIVDPKEGKRAILAAVTRTAVAVAAWAENGVKMGVDKGTGLQTSQSKPLLSALQHHRAQLVLEKDKGGTTMHGGKCARRGCEGRRILA